jgi:hypothetical protein
MNMVVYNICGLKLRSRIYQPNENTVKTYTCQLIFLKQIQNPPRISEKNVPEAKIS